MRVHVECVCVCIMYACVCTVVCIHVCSMCVCACMHVCVCSMYVVCMYVRACSMHACVSDISFLVSLRKSLLPTRPPFIMSVHSRRARLLVWISGDNTLFTVTVKSLVFDVL